MLCNNNDRYDRRFLISNCVNENRFTVQVICASSSLRHPIILVNEDCIIVVLFLNGRNDHWYGRLLFMFCITHINENCILMLFFLRNGKNNWLGRLLFIIN